jgi:hypothetical protein
MADLFNHCDTRKLAWDGEWYSGMFCAEWLRRCVTPDGHSCVWASELKERFLSHRLPDDYTAIEDAICAAWRRVTADAGRLASLTGYPWIMAQQYYALFIVFNMLTFLMVL